MSNTKCSIEMLQGECFTFIVGSEKTKFMIQISLVSNASKVLSTMINCGMKETIERVCELPDVSTEVFESFAAYVYTGDYPEIVEPRPTEESDKKKVDAISSSKSTIEAAQKTNSSCLTCNPNFILIREQMIKKGVLRYRCRTCDTMCHTSSNCNFPYCDIHNSRQACVIGSCVKAATAARNTLCVDHFAAYSPLNAQPSGIPAFLADVQDLPRFRFGPPLAADSLLKALQTKSNAAPSTVSVNQCFHHARVAVFAEMYESSGLQTLAIIRLYDRLAQIQNVEHHATSLMEMVKFIYNNTKDSGKGMQYRTRHVLRRLSCEFINFHTATFLKNEAFQTALQEGGEMPMDILLARQ